MKTAGIFCILAGVSSFVLPMMGRRSFIMGLFGEHEKIAAGVALGVGALILLVGLMRKKKDPKK